MEPIDCLANVSTAPERPPPTPKKRFVIPGPEGRIMCLCAGFLLAGLAYGIVQLLNNIKTRSVSVFCFTYMVSGCSLFLTIRMVPPNCLCPNPVYDGMHRGLLSAFLLLSTSSMFYATHLTFSVVPFPEENLQYVVITTLLSLGTMTFLLIIINWNKMFDDESEEGVDGPVVIPLTQRLVPRRRQTTFLVRSIVY